MQGGLLDSKQDLDLGIQYADDIQYDGEEVYESEVHVEDVHLGDTTSVYFNVGLESESDHSEVLSLPSTSEETVTVTVIISWIDKYIKGSLLNRVLITITRVNESDKTEDLLLKA